MIGWRRTSLARPMWYTLRCLDPLRWREWRLCCLCFFYKLPASRRMFARRAEACRRALHIAG